MPYNEVFTSGLNAFRIHLIDKETGNEQKSGGSRYRFHVAPRILFIRAEKPAEVPPWKGDIALSLSLSRERGLMNFRFHFCRGRPVGRNLTLENKGVYLFGEVDSVTSVESAQVSAGSAGSTPAASFPFASRQAVREPV